MANGYPAEPPPYSSHDDFDDIDSSVFETEQQAEENVSRRYKKKDDKKKLVNNGRERSASSSSVRLQLNRLSEKEVADATMANVFGKDALQVKENKPSSAMKVNPLYDQDGAVEVSSTEAHRIRSGSVGSIGEDQNYDRKSKYSTTSSSKPYKKSKKKTDSDDEDDGNGAQEPKIAYSKNFRFKGPSKQNGQAKGPKKLTTGRIMPSRISRNAIPGSQIMASLAGKERPKPPPEYKEQPRHERHPDDVEAVVRRSEMRKKWRLLVALILIILIFSLILVVVLLFATKAT